MKEIIVKENEAGQRLDKLLHKYLSKAPKSFLYKMLRKKNITLNGKKALGNELTVKDDIVRIFLADDTYARFSEEKPEVSVSCSLDRKQIVYEDHHIMVINKPSGVLSQKAKPEDISVNEMMIAYLLEKGELTREELKTFRPSVCNRLDRNTSGLLIAGKTLNGLQAMSKILQDRSLHKYYQCLVSGRITEKQRIEGYLLKDEQKNTVKVIKNEVSGAKLIVTEYTPLWCSEETTLLEVWLITGRSHQIRAHLASTGHPIIGDFKYGKEKVNRYYRKQYGLQSQLLHSARMVMPKITGELSYLSGRTFKAPLPEEFEKIRKECGYGNVEFSGA